MNAELLKELGLDLAAKKLEEKQEFKRKMAIAYEHFRFLTPKVLHRFNIALEKKTRKRDKYGAITYDRLVFQSLAKYPQVPPPECLQDLKKAKEMNCFDSFEVGKVEAQEVRPDPIIVGRINNCDDRFFITQWDNDVKIEDILEKGEG